MDGQVIDWLGYGVRILKFRRLGQASVLAGQDNDVQVELGQIILRFDRLG